MDERRALIESLVENAMIPQNDIWRAKELLSVSTDEQLIELARLLAEDPKAGHTVLTLSLRKVRALATQNEAMWGAIIEEEKAALLAV
ncbi:MAG: hypothetical protein WCO52_01225 [bacterium]